MIIIGPARRRARRRDARERRGATVEFVRYSTHFKSQLVDDSSNQKLTICL